ncbi:unnamed protein product [Callosobruchus maculatus]|uniref:Uncharacterized protein n=1 Tax=Callosobruchus maculatus TaxID=64391 RepID=A0A653DEX0_CALMS|nr:unnamed protein product [Callosobruchus maculatus]
MMEVEHEDLVTITNADLFKTWVSIGKPINIKLTQNYLKKKTRRSDDIALYLDNPEIPRKHSLEHIEDSFEQNLAKQ